MFFINNELPHGKAQVDVELSRKHSIQLPERILRKAQAEYDRQYPGQPYEKMQSRGGLSIFEILVFLTERIERLEAKKK